MKRTIPGFFVVLTLLAACAAPGGGSQGASPPDDRDDGETSGGIEHPGGTEPIVVVEQSGGFVPVQFMATQVPSLAILGDGRVIIQGAQTLEFPGPALPALMERTLTEDGIQEVLRTIEDTGLFTSDVELNGAQGVVADASNTIFTLNAGGEEVTVSVYGLGAVLPDTEPPPGMTSGEIEAHRILVRLNEGLTTLDTWLPATAWEREGWQPYEPEAFRLYVRDVTGQPIDGGGLPEQVREWPTDDDPAAFGEEEPFFGDGTRCGVVDGELGALWLEELNAATQMTLWTTDGENRFSVMARPVLPHEDPACPELAGGA
jgi:hypothetical protein